MKYYLIGLIEQFITYFLKFYHIIQDKKMFKMCNDKCKKLNVTRIIGYRGIFFNY